MCHSAESPLWGPVKQYVYPLPNCALRQSIFIFHSRLGLLPTFNNDFPFHLHLPEPPDLHQYVQRLDTLNENLKFRHKKFANARLNFWYFAEICVIIYGSYIAFAVETCGCKKKVPEELPSETNHKDSSVRLNSH
nr:MAG TPA: hypothetical protein [Caudoviricetes sp.]